MAGHKASPPRALIGTVGTEGFCKSCVYQDLTKPNHSWY